MSAKTKELRERIAALIETGSTKQSTYNTLKGQGVSDARLAFMVACFCTQKTVQQNTWRIRGVLLLMFVQAFFVSLLGLSYGLKIGGAGVWLTPLLMTAIPVALIYGFFKDRLWAYNAYIMLTITGLPSQLRGLADDTQGTLIGLAINILMLAYIAYVRYRLFPEVAFMTPAKRDGDYFFPAKAA